MEGGELPAPPKGEKGGRGDREERRIVVILVGAPGSGKSTFCEDVMRAGRRPWVRVCQDNIANGKAGTKMQCLKSASNALKEGKNVLIDRCNLDVEQRAEFVKLSGSHVDMHAVVLDLPARLCISRSVKRSGHEGNLQGGKAAAVVNRMLQKKEFPKLMEGFSRILFCRNESDVQDAVNMYSNLGPLDSLPEGCFGKKGADSKVQVGIMKFLKKIEPPSNVASNGSSSCVASEGVKCERDCSELDPEKRNDSKNTKLNGESEGSPRFTSHNDVHTLAFPSISTSDFQFDHEKASDIIVEKVCDFLKKVENARLVLVDLSHRSNILSLVRSKAAKANIDSKKFFTFVGDITRLSSEGNLRCDVVANAANWRLKPGGGGVNAAIFNAAGEALESATRECAGTLNPGSSVTVPLPSSSPLYQREGVTHVIQVLGPNMNPQRPNYLRNDYDKGCSVLRDAYSSLFKNFASIIENQTNIRPEETSDRRSGSDQKMKRDDCQDPERNKKSRGDDHGVQSVLLNCGISEDNSSGSGFPANSRNTGSLSTKQEGKLQKMNAKENKTWSSWAQALHQMAMHPEKHKDNILEISENYIVLIDLYPKAKKHILVLSRQNDLDSLSDAQRVHLPLLKKMHSVGLKWAEKFINDDATLIFRLGYHSIPSMRQLHLHVISQDFDSPHLKNKKHWNSFNTAFFRDSVDAMEEIDQFGHAIINSEDLLSTELRCHRCRSAHPNIPKLKAHVRKCGASFPSDLLQNRRLVIPSSF